MNDVTAPQLTQDAWLSGLIGRPAYHLSTPSQVIAAPRTVLPQESPVFVDTKVPADAPHLAFPLHQVGFVTVDTNLLFSRPTAQNQPPLFSRFATPDDLPHISWMGEYCFRFSRFHMDPKIGEKTGNAVKKAWVENYFTGKRGDYMVVAEIDGRVAGFTQLLSRDNDLVIDLIAVHPDFRGRGVSADMMNFAGSNCGRHNTLSAGTQAANASAIRTYIKDGFQFQKATYVLHFHG